MAAREFVELATETAAVNSSFYRQVAAREFVELATETPHQPLQKEGLSCRLNNGIWK